MRIVKSISDLVNVAFLHNRFPKSVSGATFIVILSVHIYTHEKREIRLSFTPIKGFAIPVTCRKTTEVHARYVQPTTPFVQAWSRYKHTYGTFIVVVATGCEFCEDSDWSQTTSINVFYFMLSRVLRLWERRTDYYTVGGSGSNIHPQMRMLL